MKNQKHDQPTLTIAIPGEVKSKFKAAAALKGIKLTEALEIALTEFSDRVLQEYKTPFKPQKTG